MTNSPITTIGLHTVQTRRRYQILSLLFCQSYKSSYLVVVLILYIAGQYNRNSLALTVTRVVFTAWKEQKIPNFLIKGISEGRQILEFYFKFFCFLSLFQEFVRSTYVLSRFHCIKVTCRPKETCRQKLNFSPNPDYFAAVR